MDDQLVEVRRTRWTRVRSRLGLADVSQVAFGQAAFGGRLGQPSARLLVLPGDPEAASVDWDQDFWDWWKKPRPDPAAGGNIVWGGRHSTSIDEAAIAQPYNGEWEQYLAVHRSGGLDMGLGGGVRYNRNSRGEPQGIQLIKVVGRMWAALAAYQEVLDRYKVEGPWQVTIALVGVGKSPIGLFASGWDDSRMEQPAEVPDHQMFSLDITDWPADPDGVRDLAMRLGGVVADAWDLGAHPFLMRSGSTPGEFDRERYSRL